MVYESDNSKKTSILTRDQIIAIKSLFAWLFPTRGDIQSICSKAGLHPGPIPDGAKAADEWEKAVKQASRRGVPSLRRLLETGRARYPDDPGLNAFLTLLDFVDQHGMDAIRQPARGGPESDRSTHPQPTDAPAATSKPAQTPPDASSPSSGSSPAQSPAPAPTLHEPERATAAAPRPEAKRQLKAFYACWHQASWAEEKLVGLLGRLKEDKIVETWAVRKISNEVKWRGRLSRHLEEADLIIVLVNRALLDSGYCGDAELSWAGDLHRRGQARLIPVILENCAWRQSPLSSIKPVPASGRPVAAWDDPTEPWGEVLEAIIDASDQLRFR